MSNNRKHQKALDLIQERGLDGLIVYSEGTCSILGPSYLYYFSEFRPMGPHNAAVLSKGGDVVLLVAPPRDALRAANKSWIDDVRGSSDFMGDLDNLMGKFGMTGTVGVVGSRSMVRDVYRVVEKRATVVLSDDVVEEIAREKTEKDLENVRKVGRLSDIGFSAFLEYARPGIREYELVAEMEYAMRSAGSDDIFILLSSGTHNYEMHEPTDRRLRTGDVVIGEITPVCEGQFIQICRTVVLGKPSRLLTEKYDILVRALKETLGQVRAGAPASLISKVMNEVISDAGYHKYCYPPYMRARGHGFGAGSIAPGGVIDDDIKVDLERNQVVVVHPNQYIPEVGYLACGETYLITDNGYEELAETETRLYVREE